RHRNGGGDDEERDTQHRASPVQAVGDNAADGAAEEHGREEGDTDDLDQEGRVSELVDLVAAEEEAHPACEVPEKSNSPKARVERHVHRGEAAAGRALL